LWERLSEREFESVFKNAYKYFGEYIVLYISPEVKKKVGFVASKKSVKLMKETEPKGL